MTNPIFSIITPVYNSEHFLKQNLDSVLAQDFSDFEVILVDDGSTDSSLDIIKEYAEQDKRIKYFSKENEGQGVARNFALPYAQGEYILYLDSDDWLVNDALSFLYDKFQEDNSDIIIFNAYKFYEESKKKNEYRFSAKYFQKFQDKPFRADSCQKLLIQGTGGLPFKAYKKSLLVDNNVKYSPTRFIEDSEFYIKALLSAETISCSDKCLVNYRVYEGSTTFREASRINVIKDTFFLCEKIVLESKYGDSKDIMISFLHNRINQLFYYYDVVNNKTKKAYYDMLKEILTYTNNKYGLDVIADNANIIMIREILKSSFYEQALINRRLNLFKILLKCYLEI